MPPQPHYWRMEINHVHNEHEHASVSLKVILLVFAIVLVGALSYLVYLQRSAPDITDYSAPSVKKTTSTTRAETTEDTALACGDTKLYGFAMTFGNLWTGYKIKEVKPGYALITCYINMPTASTDEVWTSQSTTNFAKYASLFAVSVYTPAQWTTAQAGANKPTLLDQNGNYVWGWSPAQAYPDDLATVAADVENIVATFKLVP